MLMEGAGNCRSVTGKLQTAKVLQSGHCCLLLIQRRKLSSFVVPRARGLLTQSAQDPRNLLAGLGSCEGLCNSPLGGLGLGVGPPLLNSAPHILQSLVQIVHLDCGSSLSLLSCPCCFPAAQPNPCSAFGKTVFAPMLPPTMHPIPQSPAQLLWAAAAASFCSAALNESWKHNPTYPGLTQRELYRTSHRMLLMS